MENKNKPDNSLAPVVSKLINIIIILLVFILALIALLVILVPKPMPKVEQNIVVPLPDKFGNFTEEAKQEALKIKDTTNYWIAPDIESLTGNNNKNLIACFATS